MFKQDSSGFSFIQILVLASGIFILATTGCLDEFNTGRIKAKEAEIKANCHTIQIALERYATDHSGAYPNYLFGGDKQGWDPDSGCLVVSEAADFDHTPPLDPLIDGDYIFSYPNNPFVDPGEGLTEIIALTGTDSELGHGDVRFGWTGELMGNCLDDPRYLFDGEGNMTRMQYTMPAGRSDRHRFYAMGGLPDGKAFWPGQFFYRAGGDFYLSTLNIKAGDADYEDIWGWPYMRINKYLLGGYSSGRTDGMDVIRLTTMEGAEAGIISSAVHGFIEGQYYQAKDTPTSETSHSDFNIRVKYSNPEVHGGGEEGLMPQFPYYTKGTHAWMFGAPDGYRDGVIIVLTSGSDMGRFQEWDG